MNQILSNIQKVVDDSVLLFTLKVSEKYNVNQNELYDLWKEMCGNDNGNDCGNEAKPRKVIKKKTPKSKKEKVVKSPLEKKKISDLKKMCKELGLKKYSTLKKKQLIELLQQQKEKVEKEPPLEEVLDNVLEGMEKLDIKEEMENNSPAKIYYEDALISFLKKEHKDEEISYALKDYDCFEKDSFKFGDILDIGSHRHYGYTFVGKGGIFQNSTRKNAIDSEDGVTVPITISKYLTDTVSKYSNIKYGESCIIAYELPYHDVTVQQYNVEKEDHMYEYGCWNPKYGYDVENWYLEQINIQTGERTKPSKKNM